MKWSRKKRLIKMNKNRANKCILILYSLYIWYCCSLVCLLVISLTFYNWEKSNEYKREQTKLDSISAIQDSIKLEIDKDKVLKLQTMKQQFEKQTDTMSSQLSALTTEFKSIKKCLKTVLKKEK